MSDYVHPLKQFAHRVNAHPSEPYLHQPVDQVWTSYTWAEIDKMARKIAAGLKEQGLQAGDRVAILGKNSVEWFVSDFAIAMAGMVSVPIYATAGTETINYVLEHSEAKVLFIGRLDDTSAVESASHSAKTVGYPYKGINADQRWSDWISQYEPLTAIADPELSDLYSIVYTSGSTGKPKGVCLTALNLASAATDMVNQLPSEKNRTLSYLPLAHITERSVVAMASVYSDIQVFFNESLATFLSDLNHCKPTVFLSVPRLWSKFQSGILAKMPDSRLQLLLKIPFVGNMVAKKLREGLGLGEAKLFLSGSAPISAGLLRWYSKIGIDIIEGWGMSETSGGVCANVPFNPAHIGTIGRPYPCIELKLGDGGELLIRGDAIFSEYYKNPEVTAQSFEDGWFKTGDCAKQTADGAWMITGRVKEQFKTAKGKYVVPVPIESTILGHVYVEQCCVMGAGKPQPVVLIVLAEGLTADKNAIAEELSSLRAEVNGGLESHQRLDHFIVVNEVWSIENEMLTPTLKLKRNALEAKYAALLERKFSEPVVWE